MNFRWLNVTILALASSLLIPEASSAATPGPEVAVMEIQVGRDKKSRRQIVIGLYDDATPATVANFKELIRRNFYRGIRFHRVLPNALVQTGDPLARLWLFASPRPLRAGTGGPGFTVPAEIRVKPSRGAVAMARLPDTINPSRASNGSQFFVLLDPAPKLEGQYTVFGEILEGLDILDEISNLPADSNDFPLQNITIRNITLAPRLAEPARQ